MLAPNDGHVIHELEGINGKQTIERGDRRRKRLIALDIHPWQENVRYTRRQTKLLWPGASKGSAIAGKMLPCQAYPEVVDPCRREGMNVSQVDIAVAVVVIPGARQTIGEEGQAVAGVVVSVVPQDISERKAVFRSETVVEFQRLLKLDHRLTSKDS